ncbi:MAG: hypothetical protein JXB04_11250, partial [Kiritimatiellae bacterium]|nr:hypothetical protein [Kiritimatiellia bacterium]
EGPAAASISALKLCPLYGLDLTALERSPLLGRVGRSFFIHQGSSPSRAPSMDQQERMPSSPPPGI